MKWFQQGDCLIKPTHKVLGRRNDRRNILIEGEHTGHAHRVTEGEFEIYTLSNRIILNCITQCLVTHEEHKAISLAPGVYEIDQVLEYDHLRGEVRAVND